MVDKKAFRDLLKYQHPQMKDEDIPHHTKLTQFILEKANFVKGCLGNVLKVCVIFMVSLH